MDLDHCRTCEGTHPSPLDDRCPFPPQGPLTTRRVTRQTRCSPSLSPPPRSKRGRGGRRGGRQPTSGTRPPPRQSSPDAAHNQPDPPQLPDQPTPRAPSLQPSVVNHPAGQQAAAIQAIADQLQKMQKDVCEFQAVSSNIQPKSTGNRNGQRRYFP